MWHHDENKTGPVEQREKHFNPTNLPLYIMSKSSVINVCFTATGNQSRIVVLACLLSVLKGVQWNDNVQSTLSERLRSRCKITAHTFVFFAKSVTDIPLSYWELALPWIYANWLHRGKAITAFVSVETDIVNHQLKRSATPVGMQELFQVPYSQECTLNRPLCISSDENYKQHNQVYVETSPMGDITSRRVKANTHRSKMSWFHVEKGLKGTWMFSQVGILNIGWWKEKIFQVVKEWRWFCKFYPCMQLNISNACRLWIMQHVGGNFGLWSLHK